MSVDEKIVFVSHATADKALVDEIVNLIDTGMKVPRDHIYQSSKRSLGTPAGDDFRNTIGKHLNSSKVVVIVMTSNYMGSPYCLGEMGAAWATDKRVFVLIVGDTGFDDVKGFLEPRDIGPLIDRYRLTELYKAVCAAYSFDPDGVNWEIERDTFLGKIGPIVANLPRSKPVSHVDFDKEVAVKNGLQLRLQKALQEIEDQKRIISEIIDAKITADQARQIVLEHLDETQQFVVLCESMREAIADFDQQVVKALFHNANGEALAYANGFTDPDANWNNQQIDRAIEDGFLVVDEIGDRGTPVAARPNKDFIAIEEAIEKISELQEFLISMPSAVRQPLRLFYGFTPDLSKYSFWAEIESESHLRLKNRS